MRARWLILGIVIVGIVIAAIVIPPLSKGSFDSISATSQIQTLIAATVPPVANNVSWTPRVQSFGGVDMVLVPPGCFDMGSTDGADDEKPVTRLCIKNAFWIDKTEVTQHQFKQLGGTTAKGPNFTGDNRPVENITWLEARHYCQSRDARLPTEEEWEYAARGPDDVIYPWGNGFDANKAVWHRNYTDGTTDVATIPSGASWVGALDMAGNVWEWTSTIYKPYPYDPNDGRETPGDISSARVIRGGSWLNADSSGLRTSARSSFGPSDKNAFLGVRCARS